MNILIPTYGRADIRRQHTLKALNEAGIVPILVIQNREKGLYEFPGLNYIKAYLPDHILTIDPTRDWIMESFVSEKVLMLDDDLTFAKRREDEPTKFTKCTGPELAHLIGKIEDCLDDYDHVGVSGREGANNNTKEFLYCARAMRVLAYNRSAYFEVGAKFADVPLMCDFHMTLSFLRAGAPNVLINSFVQDQIGSSHSPGGCSEYRNDHTQAQACLLLKKHHPEFVNVEEKTTKVAWGGGTRTDVRIFWKRAYASSPNC